MGSRVCESSSCITLCMSSPMGLPPGACCLIIRIWCSAVISIRPKWSNGSIPTAASANWPRARFTMAVSPTPTATPASSCAWNWIRTCARLRHWCDDNSLYRESKEGRITWTFGVPAPFKKPNPFSPWTPRPEHCFGRAAMFRRLETAFDERRSMWLVGDWRIGKTLLLMAWEKRLRERGVTVKLVSGQGPAGVSAARFVESVTGLDSPPDADGAADRLTAWIDAASSSGNPPVVLVDEVESVVQSCDVRFFDRLRDLLGRICVVFSSREAPDEVFTRNNKASPITNRMETAWIGLLEP